MKEAAWRHPARPHTIALTFIEEGIIHYCVPNIPSIVARQPPSIRQFSDAIIHVSHLGLKTAISY